MTGPSAESAPAVSDPRGVTRLNSHSQKMASIRRNRPCGTLVLLEGDYEERYMFSIKKLGVVALAATTIAGSTLAMTSTAEARFGGRGGFHGAGFHGGGFHGGGFRGRGLGIGLGLGVASGLALGAYGAGYGYGYGYPGYYGVYDDGYYGDCVIRRRVHYTPYGPVVRHVRVCY